MELCSEIVYEGAEFGLSLSMDDFPEARPLVCCVPFKVRWTTLFFEGLWLAPTRYNKRHVLTVGSPGLDPVTYASDSTIAKVRKPKMCLKP